MISAAARSRNPPEASAEYIVADQRRMSRATNYFAWQYRLAEAFLGRRVLEIGCGLGNFTDSLLDRELVLGIDSAGECVELRRQRFASHANVVGLQQDILADGFLELLSYAPDSIVCLNVLEHVRDDGEALRQMHAVLPAGGAAVLMVPAFDALYGPIDYNLAHYRRYSKAGLAQVASAAGFQIDRLRYVNFVGFFGWWFNGRVIKRTKQSAGQIAIFDKLFVPIVSRLEHLAEPPVGQSLLAVLRKQVGA